jgi:hypothetical protein
MKIKTAILIALVAILNHGCAKPSSDFAMTIDQVDELKGFILKGISITGKVTVGCIANEDIYSVMRDGKKVLETSIRILNVAGLENQESFNGEIYEGEEVTLYIPDGKTQDVLPGDKLVSDIVSCKKGSGRAGAAD